MPNIEACTSYKGMIISICSFIINTLVMGIMQNFGVMLPTFLDEFNAGYDNFVQFALFAFYISTQFALYIGTIWHFRHTLPLAQFALYIGTIWHFRYTLPLAQFALLVHLQFSLPDDS